MSNNVKQQNNASFFSGLFIKKPMEVIYAEEMNEELPRELRLFDLLCIGIGGTVGTGIFSIAGEIISDVAGPAAMLSWIIAGVACCLSGFAYMELTARIPSSGSCYAYAYHALGEFPAFIAAWLLTLEYGVSGAGVARTWAEKVYLWVNSTNVDTNVSETWLNGEYFNLPAFAIQALSVIILLTGLRFGKIFINTITITKVTLVFFMIISGFYAFDQSNFTPFFHEEKQVQGIFLGASQAFFGYIGFDEVCCLAAEATNPRTTMPRAVLGVIAGTCALSALASVALAGMQPYNDIVGFSEAFDAAGLAWAAPIARIGEILTLPVVVLIAFLAQPRLQYAMAVDGLLPPIFAKVDEKGNLWWNTVITGTLFSLIALVVPFANLWSLVNFGVLMSFNLTNLSLIAIRISEKAESAASANPLLGFYTLVSGVLAFVLQKGLIEGGGNTASQTMWVVLSIVLFVVTFGTCIVISTKTKNSENTSSDSVAFMTPLVPFIPCLAIQFNWYLIAQLDVFDLCLSAGWLGLATITYFCYGYCHSTGRRTGWEDVIKTGVFVREDRPSMSDVKPSPSWMYSENTTTSASSHFSNTKNSNTVVVRHRVVNQDTAMEKGGLL